ncbi:MAG: Coenzyme F420 hydrogenase/dehydrogenase, beta subunit C-terminal domain [Planctomycetia bacterium]|nr:Coenzyme F420 hydrogenase/dehydrogenase, beta subunit C-terminal domain [Planctomycetia bacterium]
MKNVLHQVLPWGYCCNCGVCSAVCPAGCLEMAETEIGEYRPSQTEKKCTSCGLCLQVCPYSGVTRENEETLGNERFASQEDFRWEDFLGWFHQTYYGAVADTEERQHSPSGGLTTAVLRELFRRGKIDAAIVAEPLPQRPWFRLQKVTRPEALFKAHGSVYHTMTWGSLLREILHAPAQRYAVVALPCVVKALRLAEKRLPGWRSRMPYILSLACGGCASLHRADFFTVLLGDNRSGICYRNKKKAQNAADTCVTTAFSRNSRSIRAQGILGFFYLFGIGNLKSCLLCDDLFSELADATFMEALVEPFVSDPRGTNLVISRHPEISEILETGFQKGNLQGGILPPSQVFLAQAKNARKRRKTAGQCYHYERKIRPQEIPVPAKRPLLTESPFTCLDEKEIRRRLLFHQETRRILQKFSQHYAHPERWYCRLYTWRVLWKLFSSAGRCTLTQALSSDKTDRSTSAKSSF